MSAIPASDRQVTGRDNAPPDPLVLLEENLARTHASLIARFTELEVGVLSVPQTIDAEDDAARATDFIAQLQEHVEKARKAHKAEKEEFLKAGRLVDNFFLRRIDKLALAFGPLKARLEAYGAAKRRREREEQEAQRRAAAERQREATRIADAAAAEAQRLATAGNRAGARAALEKVAEADRAADRARAVVDAPPVKTRVQGEYGSTGYTVKKWTFEIEDPSRIPLGFLMPDEAAIQEAIDEGERSIAGIRIFESEQFRVRRA